MGLNPGVLQKCCLYFHKMNRYHYFLILIVLIYRCTLKRFETKDPVLVTVTCSSIYGPEQLQNIDKFKLFGVCDLDLDLMTLVLILNLLITLTYLHA